MAKNNPPKTQQTGQFSWQDAPTGGTPQPRTKVNPALTPKNSGGGASPFDPANFNATIGHDLETDYGQGPAELFGKSLYAGQGDTTNNALDSILTAANNNGAGLKAANDFNTSVINNSDPSLTETTMMDTALGKNVGAGNPYLNGILDNTRDDVYSTVMSSFGGQGNTRSGRQTESLTGALADSENRLRYQDYGQSLNRQTNALQSIEGMRQRGLSNRMTAAGNAGQLFQNSLAPGLARLNVGQIQDADKQKALLGEFGQYQQKTNQVPDHIAKYLGLAGAQGAGEQPEKQPGSIDWLGLGVGALGAVSPALFSDKNLKEDIKQVAKTSDGTKIYSYKMKGDPSGATQIGVLAQEVLKTKPNAVERDPSGYLKVDYRKAMA